MEINIGDVFGCLEVVGNYKDAEVEVNDIIKPMAESEWNKYDSWKNFYYYHEKDFKLYYNLNSSESEFYDNKKKMPISFVDKYMKMNLRLIDKDEHFLWHKHNPNTYSDFAEACRCKKLFKVRCNTCNRVFYMDSKSISCVKWRSCIGAECLASTIDEQSVDYTKSLYDWEADKNELQAIDYQLSKVAELGNPLTYYSLDERLKIAYISDIHILHHLKYYDNNINRTIRAITDKLYDSLDKRLLGFIVFNGDISSKREIMMKFLSRFKAKFQYESLLGFKSNIEFCNLVNQKLSQSTDFQKRRDRMDRYITLLKKELLSEYDFSMFELYKRKYRKDNSNEVAFDFYRKSNSYKKLALSKEIESKIHKIASLIDVYEKYVSVIEQFEISLQEVKRFEKMHSKPVEEMSLLDYRSTRWCNVYVILGNHEYVDFPDINSAVMYYRDELSKLGITLLHNNYQFNNNYLIYGGTGFAKYDPVWNANNVLCCPDFSREDEMKETTLFEDGYKKALSYAKENGLCFISVSHYPISACLDNKYDREAIYFTGHNHRNEYIKTDSKVLYADNQIGYKNNNVTFRIATTGYYLNPYYDLSDGLYRTTIPDYLQFYRYIGEDVGKGNVLYQRCQNGKADLYVVKRKGYYGFFILAPTGSSKGISIVNGGITKKLTSSTDMAWICENFDIVLAKYLYTLIPLRSAQEQLAKELKELGLSGTIHGCIVDIDFYHHIMLNPYDSSLTFYFSSKFGSVYPLDSFSDVISSIERVYNTWRLYDCDLIRKQFDEKSKQSGYLLGCVKNNYQLGSDSKEIFDSSQIKEQAVSRREGMYGVSRKVNPLQRLFSGHVLRAFDLKLTETKPKSV